MGSDTSRHFSAYLGRFRAAAKTHSRCPLEQPEHPEHLDSQTDPPQRRRGYAKVVLGHRLVGTRPPGIRRLALHEQGVASRSV